MKTLQNSTFIKMLGTRSKSLFCGLFLAVQTVFFSSPLGAVVSTWTLGGNGTWETAGNWSAGIPNATADEAVFSAATGRTITLGSNKNLGRFQFSGGGTWNINGSTINAHGILNGADWQFATMTGSTTANITSNIALQTTNSTTITFDVATGSVLNVSGVISGASSNIKKTGGGTLALSGNNTFSGGSVSVTGGTISISGSNNALGNGINVLTLDNGTLQTTGSNTVLGYNTVIGAGGATVDTASGSSFTSMSGIISGTGAFTKTGADMLILSGVNTFTGNISVNAGTLRISNDNNLGNTANDITLNGGTLETVTNAVTLGTGRNITLGAGGGTFSVSQFSSPLTIQGVISGTGQLTITGTLSNVVLTGTNTFSGSPIILDGLLSISSDANLGNAANSINFNSGTLFTTANITTSRNIAFTGIGSNKVFDVASGTTLTLNGVISGSTSAILRKQNTGTLILGGVNTFTSDVMIEGGTLSISNGNNISNVTALSIGNATLQTTATLSLGATAVNISDANSTFDVTTGTTTVLGSIIGAGTLNKTGAGTLALTSFSSFTGSPINVSAGTLSVVADNNLGNTANDLTFASGTTFQTTGVTTMGSGRNITLSAGTVTFNIGAATSAAGIISGAGAITKTGAGTLTLSGTNTFSGTPITINAGAISISSDSNLGNTANDITFGGGTLQTTATLTMGAGRAIVLNAAGGTFDVTSGTTTVQGVISGTGAFTKTSAGTLTLTGTNTFSGTPININGGTVSIASNANLGNTANDITFNNGTLQTTATLTMTAGRAITLNAGGGTFDTTTGTTTVAGVISGTGALTKTGAGTLTLTGVNTFSGSPITINQGTLSINTDTRLGNTANDITINNGSTLQTTATLTMGTGRAVTLGSGGGIVNVTTGTTTVQGVISGTGGLTKSGAGTLTVTGANTYTGTTTISGGIMQLNTTGSNAIAAGAGAITVNTGGTLTLSQANQIGDNVNLVLNGGTLSFSGTATSESLGTLSLTENSTIDFGGTNMILTFSGIGSFTAGKTLTILNWTGNGLGGGLDQIRFTDGTNLTSLVKSQIYFNFNNAPDWGLSKNYPVGVNELTPGPEPATILTGIILVLATFAFEYYRRTKLKARTV